MHRCCTALRVFDVLLCFARVLFMFLCFCFFVYYFVVFLCIFCCLFVVVLFVYSIRTFWSVVLNFVYFAWQTAADLQRDQPVLSEPRDQRSVRQRPDRDDAVRCSVLHSGLRRQGSEGGTELGLPQVSRRSPFVFFFLHSSDSAVLV